MLKNLSVHHGHHPRRIVGLGLFALLVAGATALALGVSSSFSGKTGASAPPSFGNADTAPSTPIVNHVPTTLAGKTWSITTYSNARGELCSGEKVPGGGQAIGCQAPAERFAHGPAWVQVGASQNPGGDLTQWDNAWVWGFASPAVASMKLVLTDCSARPITPDADGVFLVVFGDSDLHTGLWPYRLDVYGVSGKLLQTKRIPLEPPLTEAAQAAGTTAPVPNPACA
jgi:hypothetical protein